MRVGRAFAVAVVVIRVVLQGQGVAAQMPFPTTLPTAKSELQFNHRGYTGTSSRNTYNGHRRQLTSRKETGYMPAGSVTIELCKETSVCYIFAVGDGADSR